MKLSELEFDRAADVMAKLSGSIGKILDDDKVVKLMPEIINQGQKNATKGYALIFSKLIPACLVSHKADLFDVLAVLDDKTTEEVAKFKLADIRRVIEESADKELLDFLKSILRWTRTGADK